MSTKNTLSNNLQPATFDFRPLTLLFHDPAILVISKPAGLPTLPDGYDKTAPHVRSLLEPEWGPLWIVHRLDKETSGVLLLARSAAAHRALNLQFDAHQVEKVYHALVVGSPDWDEYTFDTPLRPNSDRRHRTIPHAEGKPAITHIKVLQRLGDFTLIEARPATGRTHQIRAHLGFVAGLPLVADALYGCKVPVGELPLNRIALHACSLTFLHPSNSQKLTIEAPYPPDFAAAVG